MSDNPTGAALFAQEQQSRQAWHCATCGCSASRFIIGATGIWKNKRIQICGRCGAEYPAPADSAQAERES